MSPNGLHDNALASAIAIALFALESNKGQDTLEHTTLGKAVNLHSTKYKSNLVFANNNLFPHLMQLLPVWRPSSRCQALNITVITSSNTRGHGPIKD